ncbi:MAG: hypothetical protein HQL66_14730 [Magnetococcales bacterium]|nr:hypothetical protein [Magnetococcales bacterium]
MPIQSSDIVFFKSQLISDTPAANGGRRSDVVSADNVAGNSFPDVPQVERIAGVVRKRKFHIRVKTNPSIEMVRNRLFVDAPSSGDDFTLLQAGTFTDTQDQIPNNARFYGLATLKTTAHQGATQIVITLESAAAASYTPIHPNDTLWISNQANITQPGASEYLTVGPNSGDVTYNGADVTINLAAPLTYDWTVGATAIKVASCIVVNSILAAVTTPVVTSTTGTVTAANNLLVNGTGSIEQTWTLTVTNGAAGTFRLDGDTLGSGVATGTTGTDFAPTNAAFSAPYFTLSALAWTGSWSTGDTVVFTTHPADLPYWEVLVVPAGTSSIGNSGSNIALDGESV